MNIISKLSSKNLFVFNLVFIGVIFGFSLAFLSFSCTTPSARGVRAQESQVIIPENAIAMAEHMQVVMRGVTDRVLPSVVQVTTVSVRQGQQQNPSFPNIPGIPWEFFFGPNQGGPNAPGQPPGQNFRSQGLGSGLIVRYIDGLYFVLTNNHVIEGAAEIRVSLLDGNEYVAELVGAEPRRDLAMLSFRANSAYPLAVLGDSDEVSVGDFAIAMGNPLGRQFSFSVTKGIISAVGRTGGPGQNINDFIQTDAPINQGNSGGPLVNIRGEVIGINTWIASPGGGGGNVGLGFAIPINNAKRLIDEFIANGYISSGWLGVSLMEPSREMAALMGLGNRRGALAAQVFMGSPANNGGISPGDFITHVNGREVLGVNQLTMLVGDLRPGELATFSIVRDGVEMSIQVLIQERTNEIASDSRNLWPGVLVVPLTDQIRGALNLDEDAGGLHVVQVVSGSPADIVGLRQGDRITSVNGEDVNDILAYYRLLREATSEELWFSIVRGESSLETLRFRR
ncbi:MAG: Do family serine endopeptidase [Spirochaetes bacterium]|nr:Do family serine endopeptidase [Spirochaetota bacterium]